MPDSTQNISYTYSGKEIIIKPEKKVPTIHSTNMLDTEPKQKNKRSMSWIKKIFQKKEGGTFFGNLIRQIVNTNTTGNERDFSDYLPTVKTDVGVQSSTWLLVGGALLALYLIFKKR